MMLALNDLVIYGVFSGWLFMGDSIYACNNYPSLSVSPKAKLYNVILHAKEWSRDDILYTGPYTKMIMQGATMAMMYMVNCLNKLKIKWEEKDTPSRMSTILITHRQIWYVCVGLQLLSS